MRTINKIILHWIGDGDSRNMDSQNFVDAIRDMHMAPPNNYIDIGYHYLIGRSGKVYDGRPDSQSGAHCYGYNSDSLGVNLLYGTADKALTDESYKALIKLLAELCAKYNIPRDNIFGHRDFLATQCPGDFIYAKIQAIINDLKRGNFEVGEAEKPSISKFKVVVGGKELKSALIDGVGYVAVNELPKYFPVAVRFDGTTKTAHIDSIK